MDKGFWSVIHLVHSYGCVISYENFSIKYDFIINRKSFAFITKAIPDSILGLIEAISWSSTHITPCLPHLSVRGCDLEAIKIPNKTIRKMYDEISYPLLSFRNSNAQVFSKDIIHCLGTKYLKFPINPKAKKFNSKY